jgi:ribonuclease BN (tRNA processing enzyme)
LYYKISEKQQKRAGVGFSPAIPATKAVHHEKSDTESLSRLRLVMCHDQSVKSVTEFPDLPVLPAEPAVLIDAVLAGERRVLLVGAPGTGKSTLVAALAAALAQAGRTCRCLGADPGSPLFGVPGAASLGCLEKGAWVLEDLEALCTLDAGRFRLPLVAALRRLADTVTDGVLLVDGPGVVRGVAGAELLPALVEAAGIDTVLVLTRPGRPLPLAQELRVLPLAVHTVAAAEQAGRPGRHARAVRRTALWDDYLASARERLLDTGRLRFTGTPPPLEAPAAWAGRQIALLDGIRTLALGEVTLLEGRRLGVRLPAGTPEARTLLVRDAARLADGRLGSVRPFTADRFGYLPPPDVAPHAPASAMTGPRPVGRVGMLSVCLVNGVFGDPLLHARLRHRRRSLLFDLGEGARLPARVAHQVSDVFISHAHIDHIAGFLWLLRSRIGMDAVCRLYGPPGLAANIDGLARGILWDRVGDGGPRFMVHELHGALLRRYTVQAGRPGCVLQEERPVSHGVVLAESGFRVRAVTLAHVSPVLAYALEPARDLNVRKDRLQARRLAPGPWLGELKRKLQAGENDAHIVLPDGSRASVAALAADLVLISPGKTLVYATDFADCAENRTRAIALAQGAHTLFCEATFRVADAAHAARTAHLTTRACAEIAQAAGVARLVPFHFSRRYAANPGAVYAEIAEFCNTVVLPGDVARDDGPGTGDSRVRLPNKCVNPGRGTC